MTIKNKKTKQTKEVSSSGTSESKASSSVQKSTSTSTSVQQRSSSSQKVTSSGKKVRYIDVKVEEDDPLMITDITDHASLSGSTISEHYNSHPHYIITEAPSMTDLSQLRSSEHHASDMSLSTGGEFVSSSMQQSSSTQQQSSKSETFQTSSSSTQQQTIADSSHQSMDNKFESTSTSTSGNQTLNTAFIDSSGHQTSTERSFLNRSHGANATDTFLQSERQDLINKSSVNESQNMETNKFSNSQEINNQKRPQFTQQVKTLPQDNKRRVQAMKTDSFKFYGGEGSLDKENKSKQYSSTSQTSENKSSSVTKSSSSSYVVEIVDGKERIIDSSSREWGDAQDHSSKEAFASISGTDIKPETVYSSQNYDMKSKYDTGKDGQPRGETIVKEDSKLLKDGNQVSSHSNVITSSDISDSKFIKDRGQTTSHSNVITSSDNLNSKITDSIQTTSNITSSNDILNTKFTKDANEMSSLHSNVVTSSDTSNEYLKNTTKEQMIIDTNRQQEFNSRKNANIDSTDYTSKITSDDQKHKRQNINKTDASNFYGYDSTIDNELKKVNEILHVDNVQGLNFSNKIMKSSTSSAQQASSSSYKFETVDGKERVVDSSHREWGDSKEKSAYEKSHSLSGTGIKPEHQYSRHVLDKESYYDTGKDGVPKSSIQMSEESLLMKNGQEIASTSNKYGSNLTKKHAITEHVDERNITDRLNNITEEDISSIKNYHTSSDVKSKTDVTRTTDFISNEKMSSTKENSSTIDNKTTTKDTKDTLTTYEKSTGTWNGKFVYEKVDDTPKKSQPLSPFGKPEQPRHHLQRQDTEDNIIISSRDIKDFTSISDLRKIIETTQSRKDVKVSDKNIVINRNIDDNVLKEIIQTVKKYPFKRIEKVSFGTNVKEDVKDLYEGIDTEETTVVNTAGTDLTKTSYEIEKTRSQIEVTRYITENGVTRKIVTYEEPKDHEKVKTNVFVDKSSLHDIKNSVS